MRIRNNTTMIRGTGLAACLAAIATFSQAQSYPNKPIRLITQFSAGASGDTVVRKIGRAHV